MIDIEIAKCNIFYLLLCCVQFDSFYDKEIQNIITHHCI